MPQISLQPISRDNWEACANLNLLEDQTDSLPNNLRSIAELQFYPETTGVAIMLDDTVIGFATYGTPVGTDVSKLFRLMIDAQYQGNGYGRQALDLILDRLSGIVEVCYHPGKPALKEFYASAGFVEVGVLPSPIRKEGKMLARLER